jgi:hypothetical protein
MIILMAAVLHSTVNRDMPHPRQKLQDHMEPFFVVLSVPCTVGRSFHKLSHLILITALQGPYFYHHFIEKRKETWEDF